MNPSPTTTTVFSYKSALLKVQPLIKPKPKQMTQIKLQSLTDFPTLSR